MKDAHGCINYAMFQRTQKLLTESQRIDIKRNTFDVLFPEKEDGGLLSIGKGLSSLSSSLGKLGGVSINDDRKESVQEIVEELEICSQAKVQLGSNYCKRIHLNQVLRDEAREFVRPPHADLEQILTKQKKKWAKDKTREPHSEIILRSHHNGKMQRPENTVLRDVGKIETFSDHNYYDAKLKQHIGVKDTNASITYFWHEFVKSGEFCINVGERFMRFIPESDQASLYRNAN